MNAVNALLGTERYPLIFEGEDRFEKQTQSYGVRDRPDDYLESFNTFIVTQLNQSQEIYGVLDWHQFALEPLGTATKIISKTLA